ncbi:MAG: methylmalonyl Co-A mutase-associated GTPase MeaB [Oscillospiraceae bacterium]|nr:methylmalonyl Co-A mutase-associated GTPase MeaB [Oscillospiraceae bacterium]
MNYRQTEQLKEGLLNGNKRAAARLITMLENMDEAAFGIISECYAKTGAARIIGVTGPPGAGKSTLTDKLVKELRKAGRRVGVIAVDPTSPFTGGAILGDRVRMTDLATDEGVFIRSLATRGALGGISKAVFGVVKVLDILGMDYILIETAGVGQSEIDIVRIADMVIVVMTPGLGDDIQGIKAGIMEIADLFVVNKADREGADRTVAEIRAVLELNTDKTRRRPGVVKAVALDGAGIPDILNDVADFLNCLGGDGQREIRRRESVRHEIAMLAGELFYEKMERKLTFQGDAAENLIDRVVNKRIDPYSAAKSLVQ